MTVIRANDRELHHSDGSHRWTGGPGTKTGDEAWRDRLEAHMAEHRAGADWVKLDRQRTARQHADVVE
jgi:hypothetical protein